MASIWGNTGFTPGIPVFTHFTSAWQRYAPHEMSMTNNNKVKNLDIKRMGWDIENRTLAYEQSFNPL